MKIRLSQLRSIIKEEVQNAMTEARGEWLSVGAVQADPDLDPRFAMPDPSYAAALGVSEEEVYMLNDEDAGRYYKTAKKNFVPTGTKGPFTLGTYKGIPALTAFEGPVEVLVVAGLPPGEKLHTPAPRRRR